MQRTVSSITLVAAFVIAGGGSLHATSDTTEPGAPTTGGLDIDALLATDLEDCADAPTGDPIKIGYAADLSDLGGFVDTPASASAEHFVNLVNCAGGFDGSPLELIIQNIEGDPEVTARAAQDLLDEGVSAILGPPFADFGQPLLQVTQAAVPVLFVASTEPTLADVEARSFLTAFDDTAQATAAAEFALEQGWQTAVTFSSPGPYFGFVPDTFTEVFEAGGGTVLSDYTYVPLEDVDFSTQVNEIAGLDEAPDLVYSAMLPFQAAPLMEQLVSAGVETTFFGADSFEAAGGYVTDGVDGFYATTHVLSEPDSRVAMLDASFAAATGAPFENPSFAALAADAILVVLAAADSAGATDGESIGAAIPDVSVEGITGLISYDGGAIPTKPVYITLMVDGAPTLAAEAS